MEPITIITTGGGTGGHLYPAIAVLEALQMLPNPPKLIHIGHPKKIEAEKIPTLDNVEFKGIAFTGMPKNKIWLGFWLLNLLWATVQASLFLLKRKPNLIYATGGYVTAPVLLAAQLLKIPYVVHEPDAHPGKVNKLFAPKATAVTSGFEAARLDLKNNHFNATGNPLRKGIGKMPKAEAFEQLQLNWPMNALVLLVIGGSQGAHSINQAMLSAANELLDQFPQLHILHQTGIKNFDSTQELFTQKQLPPQRYQLLPFIENMPAALSASGLVLARSGALSLSEFALAGLPSILVPYPYAAANHQYYNAKAFVDAGAASLILDQDLNAQLLKTSLEKLLTDHNKMAEMKTSALKLARPEATEAIVGILLNCIKP